MTEITGEKLRYIIENSELVKELKEERKEMREDFERMKEDYGRLTRDYAREVAENELLQEEVAILRQLKAISERKTKRRKQRGEKI